MAVEDDILFANTLELLVEELGYEFQTVDNAQDLYKLLPAYAPDLLLLDIHIKGRVSGLDIAKKLLVMQKQLPIIFVTSFQDKDIFERAKKIGPFAYIIKPIDIFALQRAIELALQNAQYKQWQEAEPQGWQQDIISQDSFFIKIGERLEKVHIKQIAYITVEDKYLNIFTQAKRYVARMSLQEILLKLPEDVFLRIHRSHIVNIHFIESLLPKEFFVEVLGTKLPYSDNYAEALLRKLNLLG